MRTLNTYCFLFLTRKTRLITPWRCWVGGFVSVCQSVKARHSFKFKINEWVLVILEMHITPLYTLNPYLHTKGQNWYYQYQGPATCNTMSSILPLHLAFWNLRVVLHYTMPVEYMRKAIMVILVYIQRKQHGISDQTFCLITMLNTPHKFQNRGKLYACIKFWIKCLFRDSELEMIL
jgi:hypothetical protein